MTAAPRLWLPGDGPRLDVARARWQAADRALGGHPLWCVLCRNQNCPERARLLRVERDAWAALRIAHGTKSAESWEQSIGAQMRPDTHPALEYHEPTEAQVKSIKAIRAALSEAMYAIVDTVPQCAERTLALRHIEEAAMYANKAIVFDGQRYL